MKKHWLTLKIKGPRPSKEVRQWLRQCANRMESEIEEQALQLMAIGSIEIPNRKTVK